MASDEMRKILESVARELALMEEPAGTPNYKVVFNRYYGLLECRLLPVLEAGQAMRDCERWYPSFETAWDAALQAAKEESHESH
jgi:hypothetical protein